MKTNRHKLNADELGQKGESKFPELCVDANLVCNASIRDRNGWDFHVQFPFGSQHNEVTLDQRSSPLSCFVQVKTMWEHNDTFDVRLSAAEWLVKLNAPTFFYVLKVNKELQFVEAFLIHAFDDLVVKILKALRSAQSSNDKKAINKKN